jgi:hypothetical protein
MKSSPVLPALFVAGSLAVAEVLGPHEPHVELNLQEDGPQLVGFLATSAVSTATATVMTPSSLLGWNDILLR